MKKMFLLFLSAVSLECSAQLTKTFDERCACIIVTNRFDDGTKSSEHQENSAGEKNGLETVYFPNATKQYERNWTNGRLNGKSTHYHRNGNAYLESHHNEGQKIGSWTFKDEEGKIVQTIDYGDGKGHTTHIYYHAGVKYFMQKMKLGKLEHEEVLNKRIYEQLKAETSSWSKK